MSTRFLTLCAALIMFTASVNAEEKKTLAAKLCTYFSRFPGCGSPTKNAAPTEEDDNSLQAINCGEFPMNEWCVTQRKSWNEAEIVDFWAQVKQRLMREFEEDEEGEQALIKGAVNCQAFPDAPFCVKARAQWEAEKRAFEDEEEEQDFLVGAVSCQAYPNSAYCIALRKKWANEGQ